MQTQTTNAPAPRAPLPNFYRGVCTVCAVKVPARAGFYLGRIRGGDYDVRCTAHGNGPAPVTPPAPPSAAAPPASFMGIPVIPTHTYPEVTARAMDAAIALFMRSDADGNADALQVARELVAAVAYARGVAMPTLGTVGDKVDDRQRYQAAAADLVDSLLGRPVAETRMLPSETHDANANTLANARARAGVPPVAMTHAPVKTARAPRKPAAKPTAGNPFAHRIKP